VRRLLTALQQETAAISGRSAEDLREAVSRKELATRALESAEATRREAMAVAELTAASPGVETPWGTILELLRHCRDVNEANGQLALRRARQVQGALQVLRGGTPQPATYSALASAPPGLPGVAATQARTRPLAWA
jgi:flagellar biosynthesis/type III secretory pathway chaperone